MPARQQRVTVSGALETQDHGMPKEPLASVIEGVFPERPCSICGGFPAMFAVVMLGCSAEGPQAEDYFCNAHQGWAYQRCDELGGHTCKPTPAVPIRLRPDPDLEELRSVTFEAVEAEASTLGPIESGEPAPYLILVDPLASRQPVVDRLMLSAEEGTPTEDDNVAQPGQFQGPHSGDVSRPIEVRDRRGGAVRLKAEEVAYIQPGSRAHSTKIVFKAAPDERPMEFEADEDLSLIAVKLEQATGMPQETC